MQKPNEITLDASLDNLQKFKDFINEQAESYGFGMSRVLKIELACDELLVNSINYAYEHSKGEITVRCLAVEPNTLSIDIIDSGPPFNPLEAEAPDLELNVDDRQIGGLGIFLVREMVDDMQYTRRDNQNIISLVISRQEESV